MHQKPLLIEVGACHGVDSLRFYHSGYRVFTFEPKRELYNDLYERTKHYSDYTVINKAVTLQDGEIDFNVCQSGGASSVLTFKSDHELIKHWTNARQDIHYSGVTYKVPSVRLDTFIKEHALEHEIIDYLHCDAQGADLDVLESLGAFYKNVKAGVIESAYSQEKAIYKDQNNTVDTATEWLEKHGFNIERIESNDSTQCECNIYFNNQHLIINEN